MPLCLTEKIGERPERLGVHTTIAEHGVVLDHAEDRTQTLAGFVNLLGHFGSVRGCGQGSSSLLRRSMVKLRLRPRSWGGAVARLRGARCQVFGEAFKLR